MLPAQNATGNWIKIVQRVPVRIKLDDAPHEDWMPLLIGLSATVTVDLKSGDRSHAKAPAEVPAEMLPAAFTSGLEAADFGAADARIAAIIEANRRVP